MITSRGERWRWQPPAGTLRRGFFAQGFMLVAMLPISLHLFSGAATVGGLLNLVAVPMVTLGTVPLGLAGVALHALAPGLAAWSWSLAASHPGAS